MSGLFEALVTGAALSLVSGLCALLLAGWQARRGHGGAGLWRSARWAAVAPLLLAPVIHFIPETTIAPMHAPLPAGAAFTSMANAVQPSGLDALALVGAVDWRLVAVGVYLAGLLVALAGAVLRHHRRSRLLAGSRAAPEIAQDYLSILAARVGVETPDFRLRDGLASPLLTGWNPVILAAPALLDDTAASRYALTHELVHYRRGDEQDRLLGAALMVALWFHWPLRRIERELHEAREIDCDSESLEALGGAERKPYAAALITMMRSPARLVSAFGPDDRRHREMRIKAILSGRAARPSSRLLAVMLAGVSVLPVACAQAALTERTQLAVDLSNPANNHVARSWSAEGGNNGRHAVHEVHVDPDTNHELHVEPDVHLEHDVHVEQDVHLEHDVDVDLHFDRETPGGDGHVNEGFEDDIVFHTDDGRELRFQSGENAPEFNAMFPGESRDGNMVFLAEADAGSQRAVFIDEDGNATRLRDAPNDRWLDADGHEIAIEAPAAPTNPGVVMPVAPMSWTAAEPGAEPAPTAPIDEPSPQVSGEPKAGLAPRALRQVEPVAQPAFSHPVAAGRVTSHYGNRPARPAGAPVFHGGTDIAAAAGTPVWAPADGAVIHAQMGFNGSDRWGNTVVIQHEDGWQTIYAHLDRIDVEVGDTLTAGGQLGTIGSTGASTGPHVHVELRRNGERVDPASRLNGLR